MAIVQVQITSYAYHYLMHNSTEDFDCNSRKDFDVKTIEISIVDNYKLELSTLLFSTIEISIVENNKQEFSSL